MYPSLGIMDTYWWVLPFTLLFIPSLPYFYSIIVILKGKGPMKIYEKGIQPRGPYLSKKGKEGSFLFFDSITKIALLYDGRESKMENMNLNEIIISGLRVRTKNGEKFDLHKTYYAPYGCSFPYELIQIMTKVLGDGFYKKFTLTPDVDDDEWEGLLRSSKGFMNKSNDYGVKIAYIAALATIPMFITMVLMMMDVLNGRELFIATFATISMGFAFLPLQGYLIFRNMERTGLELGTLFRAQEFEMLTGQEIIPKDLNIPQDYIFPGEDWPDFDKDFWEKLNNLKDPKSRLDRWQYSGWYRKIIRETVVKIMRYERLMGKSFIPSYIRNMDEVGDLREWGEEDLHNMSSRRRTLELRIKKINDLFEDLEEGRRVTPDIEFKPICFKKYH
jgi:hypothetical protein